MYTSRNYNLNVTYQTAQGARVASGAELDVPMALVNVGEEATANSAHRDDQESVQSVAVVISIVTAPGDSSQGVTPNHWQAVTVMNTTTSTLPSRYSLVIHASGQPLRRITNELPPAKKTRNIRLTTQTLQLGKSQVASDT